MNLGDTSKIMLDGQLVYLIDPSLNESVISDKEINGIKVYSVDLVRDMMIFIKENPGFSLICYLIGQQRRWMFCIVYRLENTWRRVQIENLVCNKCGWKGISANPAIPELYFGVPNEWDALKKSSAAQSCPQCAEKLPRDSLWTKTI
ncbi:hypothetical protein GCM10010912_36790 [Paenibacillus albidus]|uniref:Uncharacterized protein n=1 Tax=Paenibacillus albidus TaxID=2041023 RepID=A0A917CK05_9BACL|nr:hypothetical protein [Paenibacillus albidus]GGF88164.1 hypothetical protein GCM10010912_36790 [Paenibacillus albidus]